MLEIILQVVFRVWLYIFVCIGQEILLLLGPILFNWGSTYRRFQHNLASGQYGHILANILDHFCQAYLLMGAVVDPLGIFRTIPVFRTNELYKKAVETTRVLIRLVHSQINSRYDGLDAFNLSCKEVMDLATNLVNKVWDWRRGVMNTSNCLARGLLNITSD